MPKLKVRLICYSCDRQSTVEVDDDDPASGTNTLNMRKRTREVICPNPDCRQPNWVDL